MVGMINFLSLLGTQLPLARPKILNHITIRNIVISMSESVYACLTYLSTCS